MYGNETVSSMSVKSGESYPREDSMDDYDVSLAPLSLVDTFQFVISADNRPI